MLYYAGRQRDTAAASARLIIDSPRGKGGFGYDPLFYYVPLEKTFAELTADEKNRISHRAIALEKFSSVFASELEAGRICGK